MLKRFCSKLLLPHIHPPPPPKKKKQSQLHVIIPCTLTARVHEFYSPIYLWATEILSQSAFKPLAWKRYISTTFSHSWTPTERFIDQSKTIRPLPSSKLLCVDKTALTNAKVSYTSQCITYYTYLTSLLKNLRTLISSRVTHPESREVSSKGRPSDDLRLLSLNFS